MCAVEYKQGIRSEGKNLLSWSSYQRISRAKKEGRITESLRLMDLLMSSSSSPLLKQGQREGCPGSCPVLNTSMDGDSPTSLDSLCQCLTALTVKTFFSCAQSCVLVCACCLLSCQWAPLRSLAASLFSPIQYLYTLITCPLSLLQTQQS